MRILIIAIVLALAVLPGRAGADVRIQQGWNLVAWTTDTVAVEEVTDGTAIAAIYGWDGDTFTRYLADAPANTLTELETGEAYWVLSTMPVYLNTPEPIPCPTCPECPEPTPCPECRACPIRPCPTSYDWECSEVRLLAMGYEVDYILFCVDMGLPCTYLIEELAAIEDYLDEHCR